MDLDRCRRRDVELRPPGLLSFEDGFDCHRCLSIGVVWGVVEMSQWARAKQPKDIRHVFFTLQQGWANTWAGTLCSA